MKDLQKFLDAGRYEEAGRLCREFTARRPDQPAGLAGLGWVAMKQGHWETAITLWDECLDRFPRRAELSWLLAKGNALTSLGRIPEAERVYRSAADRWPAAPEPIRRLIALARCTDGRRAVALFDRLLERVPDDRRALLGRAVCRALCGAPQECRDVLETLLHPAGDRDAWNQVLHEEMLGAVQRSGVGPARHRLLSRLLERATLHAAGPSGIPAAIFTARVLMALGDHAAAAGRVRDLVAGGAYGEVLEGMARVCEVRFSTAHPDHAAPKIFGIGLSKTGTNSLDRALRSLGIRSIHWSNPYTDALISDEDLFLFEGFSDVVIAFQFERLYALFPNARFIYTTRRLDSWCRSVAGHYRRFHGVESPVDLRAEGFRQRYDGAAGRAEMGVFGDHDSWEGAYRHFDRRVRSFFADKPPEKMLEISICEGEGWERLCPFLGQPVPAMPFPLANVAPQGRMG